MAYKLAARRSGFPPSLWGWDIAVAYPTAHRLSVAFLPAVFHLAEPSGLAFPVCHPRSGRAKSHWLRLVRSDGFLQSVQQGRMACQMMGNGLVLVPRY